MPAVEFVRASRSSSFVPASSSFVPAVEFVCTAGRVRLIGAKFRIDEFMRIAKDYPGRASGAARPPLDNIVIRPGSVVGFPSGARGEASACRHDRRRWQVPWKRASRTGAAGRWTTRAGNPRHPFVSEVWESRSGGAVFAHFLDGWTSKRRRGRVFPVCVLQDAGRVSPDTTPHLDLPSSWHSALPALTSGRSPTS